MNELETKKLVANRIVSHLTQVPANAITELMKEPLASLEEILDKLATRREHVQIKQDAQAQIDAMRSEALRLMQSENQFDRLRGKDELVVAAELFSLLSRMLEQQMQIQARQASDGVR